MADSKIFRLTATRVEPDGTQKVMTQKIIQKPEFWDDPSDQAARDHALAKRIMGEE